MCGLADVATGRPRAPIANAQGQLPPPAVPIAADAYVADVQRNGRSVYDEGISIGTEQVAPLDVFIKSDGGTYDGIVNRPASGPAANVAVVLVPESTHRQNPALY